MVLGLPGVSRIVARVWNCLWGVGVTGSGQWPLVALGGLVGRSGVSGGSLNSNEATSSSSKLTGQLFMYNRISGFAPTDLSVSICRKTGVRVKFLNVLDTRVFLLVFLGGELVLVITVV